MRMARHLTTEAHPSQKHVVIVMGNPKYLNDPSVKAMAKRFYADLEKRLHHQGDFRVTYDAGEPETLPDVTAYAWVAHSRGVDRLQYAPDTVRTVALTTKNEKDGFSPEHYQLSAKDIDHIQSL